MQAGLGNGPRGKVFGAQMLVYKQLRRNSRAREGELIKVEKGEGDWKDFSSIAYLA